MSDSRQKMTTVLHDTVREDGRLERHCEHGIGHTVGHLRGYLLARYETIHGCDGCCISYTMQKMRDEL